MLPGSRLVLTVAAAGFACGVGCGSRTLQDKDPSTIAGAAGIGAGASGGAGGFGPPPAAPCPDSDPRLVVVQQHTSLLTSTQLINMIRALVNDTEALTIVYDNIFPVTTDVQRRFPPARSEQYTRIDDPSQMEPFTNVAKHVGQYVFNNFQIATQCASVTDACAKDYLDAFAEKAYRRPLDAAEQSDLDARYEAARSTGTIQDATREVVTAILVAPPFLYRSEMGDPLNPSLSPPGLPLTQYELASVLSFFLTDGPPDRLLLADARAGTLSATLGAHVDRLLATAPARAWLRTVIETLFFLNQLPVTFIDPNKIPIAAGALLPDLQEEARLFLDDTLWNANLTDLLLSRTTFLNANLATYVYGVQVPAGATATNFIRSTLPADQRSGILTNPGFLTTRSRGSRESLLYRGMAVSAMMLGRVFAPHPADLADEVDIAFSMLSTQTPRQQVTYRASMPVCESCHIHFDPLGIALDNYDVIGRYRTVGDMGEQVDAHATLPPELGSVTVPNAIELARVMAGSQAFTNGMAKRMLEYALSGSPELPDPAMGAAGCAVADVTSRFNAGSAKTFSALLRAVALSPAFSLRNPAP